MRKLNFFSVHFVRYLNVGSVKFRLEEIGVMGSEVCGPIAARGLPKDNGARPIVYFSGVEEALNEMSRATELLSRQPLPKMQAVLMLENSPILLSNII